MITKELENILKSLPAFLRMAVDARNPLIPQDVQLDRIEVVTKATWFVVPFHFMAFISLVPWNESDTTMTVVLSLITLVLLSWVGIICGLFHSFFSGLKGDLRERSMGGWAVTLTLCWFFCVVVLSIINIFIWLLNGREYWPNIESELSNILDGSMLDGHATMVLVFVVPLLATILTFGVFGANRGRSLRQVAPVFIICWLITGSMILFSLRFLTPIAAA